MDVSDLYQVDITTLPTYPINAKYLQVSKECGPDSDFGLGPTSVSCADWPYRQVDPSKITTGPAVQRRYLADDYVPRYKYSNYMFDLRAPVSCCYFQTDGTRICGPQADESVVSSYIDDAFYQTFGGLWSAVYNQWNNDSSSNCSDSGMGGEDCSDWNPSDEGLPNALTVGTPLSSQPFGTTTMYGSFHPMLFAGPWNTWFTVAGSDEETRKNGGTMNANSPAQVACKMCMTGSETSNFVAKGQIAQEYNSFNTYDYDALRPPLSYYLGTYGGQLSHYMGIGTQKCTSDSLCGDCCNVPVGPSFTPTVGTCNERFVGILPDCPTPMGEPGSCLFSTDWTDPETSDMNSIAKTGACAIDSTYGWDGNADIWLKPAWELQYGENVFSNIYQSVYCSKLQFDRAFVGPCCSGAFGDLTMKADGPSPEEPFSMASVFCDPTWHPSDPIGVCGDSLVDVCSGTNSSGVPLLLDPTSGCNEWYMNLVMTPRSDPTAQLKWTYANIMVQNVCSKVPTAESCACFNYSPYTTANNYFYTSVTGVPNVPNAEPGVRQMQLASSNSDGSIVPVAFSDYMCTQPECNFGSNANGQVTVGKSTISNSNPLTTLLTSDMIDRSESCPESLCLQVLLDRTIDIGTINANSVYIANDSLVCAGSAGTISTGAPNPSANPSYNVVDVPIDDVGVFFNSIEVVNESPNVWNYTINSIDTSSLQQAFPNAPAMYQIGDGNLLYLAEEISSGSLDGNANMQFELAINQTVALSNNAIGSFPVKMIVTDSRPQYAGASVALTFIINLYRLKVEPMPGPLPPGSPVPTPAPAAPLVTYNYVEPSWSKYLRNVTIGICILGVLFLLVASV